MINREIENLIVKALFKEITDDEQRQLDEWLNVSESNRIFFERLHSEGYLKGAIGDLKPGVERGKLEEVGREGLLVKKAERYVYLCCGLLLCWLYLYWWGGLCGICQSMAWQICL